jgi:hypothetical protein
MRVAVTGHPIPACGDSRWLPRSLAKTGCTPPPALVPSRQRVPAGRWSMTAGERRLPCCASRGNDRFGALAKRNSRGTTGMPSVGPGAAPFISSRKFPAISATRARLLIQVFSRTAVGECLV